MTDLSIERASPAELEVLGHQVFCDDELGLAWARADAIPDASALARMNARNEVLLRTLALVEEHDETQAENGERAELHRLEAKLNLALELLAELVTQRETPVPARPVRFNSQGLCWRAADAAPADALLLVECYALPAWPVPLKLFGRVCSAQRSESGYQICCALEGLSAGAAVWLDKLVFRRHRRAIAQRRARA